MAGLPSEIEEPIQCAIYQATSGLSQAPWYSRLAQKALTNFRNAAAYLFAGTKPSDYDIGYLRLLKAYEEKNGRL